MEESVQVPAVEKTEPPKGAAISGLWKVFYAPTEFFTQVKDSPKIFWAWIVSILLILVFMVGAADYLAAMQIDAARAQGQSIPDEALPFMKIMVIVTGTIAFALIPLIYAAVAMFWGNFIFGGQASYKQLLCVSAYALIVYNLGAVLHLPMVFAKETIMVSYSPAILFADQGFESVAFVAAAKLGIFNIWEYFAFSIGTGVIYGWKNKNGYIVGILTLGLISAIHVLFSWVGAGISMQAGG